MSKFSKEIQIALVAIVGLVVLFIGLQFLKGLNLFSTDSRYFVKFDNISGLSVSSPVYANGYRVGVVEKILFDYEKRGDIIAVVGVDKKLRLPQGSFAEIASDLLGNIKLELVFGPDASTLMAPGDTLTGGLQLAQCRPDYSRLHQDNERVEPPYGQYQSSDAGDSAKCQWRVG